MLILPKNVSKKNQINVKMVIKVLAPPFLMEEGKQSITVSSSPEADTHPSLPWAQHAGHTWVHVPAVGKGRLTWSPSGTCQ